MNKNPKSSSGHGQKRGKKQVNTENTMRLVLMSKANTRMDGRQDSGWKLMMMELFVKASTKRENELANGDPSESTEMHKRKT